MALLCLGQTDNTTRAQRNAQESALLRLPAEIRHRIWTYAVHAQTVTMGYLDWMDRKDYPKQSVLQVCRQVHAETCLLPYSNNSFWIYDIVSLSVWLTRRLPEQIAAVQRIEISCCECSEAPLRLLTGMKHIIVYCICDGLCPTDPARSKAIKEALGGSWGNFDFKIRIVQG